MSRDKYFKGYNPDFVSAYGKRDWQKDMRLMTESREALYYWLGQYAEASNEVSFWKGEATAEKERATNLIADLLFAYINKDEIHPHDFEIQAFEHALIYLRENYQSSKYDPKLFEDQLERMRRLTVNE
ncbi:hypothetical protein [Paenibacillus lautus]|uniref:hypothetical protein n=1 Tax=Paenibacillus lautus TaxID=1401 RepID=UPI0039875983